MIFHGRQARVDVDRFYEAADIFVFPSYREPGGNAVFEAMGWGLPLVVANRGGPGSAVDETSGIRIMPLEPHQFATELANAIRRLATDRTLRLSLGRGARIRVAATALWDQKIALMEELYLKVLNEAASSGLQARSTELDQSCSDELERPHDERDPHRCLSHHRQLEHN